MSDAIRKVHSKCRARAYRRLGELYPEDFARLFHEAKHEEGVSHTHGPGNPETIHWWEQTSRQS